MGDNVDVLDALRQTALQLAQSPLSDRARAIVAIATTLALHQNDILEANTLDLEISRDMAIPERVTDWLKLTPERLTRTIGILQRLAKLSETSSPWGRPAGALVGSHESTQVRPRGLIALVYEAFPDLGLMSIGLCLQTGNGLILKGGQETSHTNQVLAQLTNQALATTDLPGQSVFWVPSDGSEASRLALLQRREIDLVIPYGRPQFVEQVVQQASVPVLPTTRGNCYLVWMPSANIETVSQMIVDSHRGEPDAVNCLEKILIVGNHSEVNLKRLWSELIEAGFQIRCAADPELSSTLGCQALEAKEWKQAYLNRTLAFMRIDTLPAAAQWINTYSSGHADAIASANYSETRQFLSLINSASLFINTSPRFYHNPKDAAAIALGMSPQAKQWGGLVGLQALMYHQRVIHGE
jgi:glutamate-5-semialdehyde dehydrogenase